MAYPLHYFCNLKSKCGCPLYARYKNISCDESIYFGMKEGQVEVSLVIP